MAVLLLIVMRRTELHPFIAGDLVICIDDTPLPERTPRRGEPWVRAGRAYRVESVSTNAAGDHGLLLVGIANWPPSAGWHAWRFRKIEPASDGFCASLTQTRVDA